MCHNTITVANLDLYIYVYLLGPACGPAFSCQHGGTCNDTNGAGACSCKTGFSGTKCEKGNISTPILK